MNAALPKSPERKIILLLCGLAAIHVFIFSAAFPFFNVVDEQLHLDDVIRYSHGDIPRALGVPQPESLQFISIYGTVEYLWPPSTFAGKKIPPPPWTLPISEVAPNLLAKEKIWKEKVRNTEASQPPLYYALAGAWWRLGKFFHLDGLSLLYWLRFLNVPLVVAFVWLGGFAARKIFPENHFICVAVPALIAFMPQTAFYSINNDILSPLTFGIAFVLLLKFWESEKPSPRLAVATGLALAATFLTKISNLPLLAVSGIFIALKIFRLRQNDKLRPSISSLIILAFCAGLPMAAWMAWCRINFGDFTGSNLKIQLLGWTAKPLAEWFQHPIFTAHGFWIFLSGNLATFWQGEFLWDGKPLAIHSVDLIYVIFTIALLALTFFHLLWPRQFFTPQRAALWFSFACLAASLAFFALLSVKYDFHDCFYPSRAHPYFTSGRLMLGALIPILLLFVCGLDRLLKRFSHGAKCFALTGIILFMLASEITIDWPIFPNPYNWFHL